jgi:hypothetical protein
MADSKLITTTDRIIEFSCNNSVGLKVKQTIVSDCIKGMLSEMINLIQNINETSIGKVDREKRVMEFCDRYGLHYNKIENKFY